MPIIPCMVVLNIEKCGEHFAPAFFPMNSLLVGLVFFPLSSDEETNQPEICVGGVPFFYRDGIPRSRVSYQGINISLINNQVEKNGQRLLNASKRGL